MYLPPIKRINGVRLHTYFLINRVTFFFLWDNFLMYIVERGDRFVKFEEIVVDIVKTKTLWKK